MRFLPEKSDERHPITVAEMISELDIVQTRSKITGRYIGERDFRLPEL